MIFLFITNKIYGGYCIVDFNNIVTKKSIRLIMIFFTSLFFVFNITHITSCGKKPRGKGGLKSKYDSLSIEELWDKIKQGPTGTNDYKAVLDSIGNRQSSEINDAKIKVDVGRESSSFLCMIVYYNHEDILDKFIDKKGLSWNDKKCNLKRYFREGVSSTMLSYPYSKGNFGYQFSPYLVSLFLSVGYASNANSSDENISFFKKLINMSEVDLYQTVYNYGFSYFFGDDVNTLEIILVEGKKDLLADIVKVDLDAFTKQLSTNQQSDFLCSSLEDTPTNNGFLYLLSSDKITDWSVFKCKDYPSLRGAVSTASFVTKLIINDKIELDVVKNFIKSKLVKFSNWIFLEKDKETPLEVSVSFKYIYSGNERFFELVKFSLEEKFFDINKTKNIHGTSFYKLLKRNNFSSSDQIKRKKNLIDLFDNYYVKKRPKLSKEDCVKIFADNISDCLRFPGTDMSKQRKWQRKCFSSFKNLFEDYMVCDIPKGDLPNACIDVCRDKIFDDIFHNSYDRKKFKKTSRCLSQVLHPDKCQAYYK